MSYGLDKHPHLIIYVCGAVEVRLRCLTQMLVN
jgi:hypothetical protein